MPRPKKETPKIMRKEAFLAECGLLDDPKLLERIAAEKKENADLGRFPEPLRKLGHQLAAAMRREGLLAGDAVGTPEPESNQSTSSPLRDGRVVQLGTDVPAGIDLYENKELRRMELFFADQPPEAILNKVKDAGYRWNRDQRAWNLHIPEDGDYQAKLKAADLFAELRGELRALMEDRGRER